MASRCLLLSAAPRPVFVTMLPTTAWPSNPLSALVWRTCAKPSCCLHCRSVKVLLLLGLLCGFLQSFFLRLHSSLVNYHCSVQSRISFASSHLSGTARLRSEGDSNILDISSFRTISSWFWGCLSLVVFELPLPFDPRVQLHALSTLR